MCTTFSYFTTYKLGPLPLKFEFNNQKVKEFEVVEQFDNV